MKNFKEQLAEKLKRAQELSKAADERDLNDDELAEVKTLTDEITDLQLKVKAADDSRRLLEGVASFQVDDDPDDPKNQQKQQYEGGLGDRFVNSDAYKAFQKAHPSGVGNGTPIDIKGARVGTLADIGRKVDPAPLALPDAHVAPLRFPTVDLTYPYPLSLLDLITRGQTGGAFEYVQITAVTNNAGIVAESATADGSDADGGLKPLSDLTTDLADAKVYTYADGYTVTNQMLSDAPAFASYLNSRMSYNLQFVIEDMILNGAGSGGEPAGVLATGGVQTQDFDTDLFRTVRKAITKVTKLGGRVTAVLMSPEDDEEWDLAQDGNQRYYGQGPFGSGPGTAWGRPRVVSQRLEQGTTILGDFGTIALLDREGLSVLAFNQHADYARRNLTYVRAELRAAQAIFEPAKLCIVDTSEGS